MRYIPKPNYSSAKSLLDDARMSMRKIGLNELYCNFSEKEQLNSLLREEQKEICCYCQRRIDHYHGNIASGSHNEHFYPEGGDNARVGLQLDYSNIYACCNSSRRYEYRMQHCGEYKGDKLIKTNFLQLKNCSDFFKYTINGEILPQCPYNSYEDVLKNRNKLTSVQQDALEMIECLNLNVVSLRKFRVNVLSDLFLYAKNRTSHQLIYKAQLINTERRRYLPLVDMLLFFLKKLVNK